MKVDVAHDRMPIIRDGTQAEALATAIHADLVIYGNVVVSDNKAKFSPMFYIAEKPDTQELTGTSELAKTIVFDLASQETVNAAMQSRAAILVYFTRGLIYLSQYDSQGDHIDLIAAADAFQRAIREAEQGPPFNGQEVLYLFAANTDRLQNNFEASMSNVDQALRLNPQYARAYIARGYIYYDQAMQADYDESKLQQARIEYENALQVKEQPEGAYIREKAFIGIGHVYNILAQKTQNADLYQQTIQMFQQGVALYEKTHNKRLRELTSIGYYGLGGAYQAQENYIQAIKAYQQCVTITEQKEGKAECFYGLGDTYYEQGDYAQAVKVYQQCVELTVQPSWKVDCFNGLGVVYEQQGDDFKAAEAYQQCASLSDEPTLKAECFAGLGNVYAKQSNRLKATEAYQQCLTLAEDAALKADCSARLLENN